MLPIPLTGAAAEADKKGRDILVGLIMSQEKCGTVANASDTIVERCKVGWADCDVFQGRYNSWKPEVDVLVGPTKKKKADKKKKEETAARIKGYKSSLGGVSGSISSARLNLMAAANEKEDAMWGNHMAGSHLRLGA